ncbi:MAG TPA: efflux RND transporter periplasmic adaptor subunit [Thermoanaerobaculia bacterium]
MSTATPRTRTLAAATRPEEGLKVLAARRGPPDEHPALRKDLGIRRHVQMGEVRWIIKNPETMKYYMYRDAEWELLELFDGGRTRLEILEEYNRRVGQTRAIDMTVVLEYEESLRKVQLMELSAAERNLNLLDKFKSIRHRKAEEKSEGFNIFFIMFHVLDPERFLQRTVKYVRWIWTPPVVAVTVVASLWTIGVFVENWKPIWEGTLELYAFLGKPLRDILHFFFILCIIGAIHEFAHAYAVKIYGGEVRDVGMALFYFMPVFYTDTADSFMFPNKWHRLWVTVAGIYVEAIICSAATALWVFSYPDSFLHQFAYKTMLLTGFATVFFNINPLIKVDGYYALTSVLELPDLREGAFRLAGSSFQKYVLRLPVEIPVMTRRKRRLYLIYGLLSMTYTASIMLIIAGWLDNFYAKYFPDFAVVLLLLSLYYIFRKRVRVAIRVGKLLYLDKKELMMSRRGRVPLIVAGAIVLLFLIVPWSRRTIQADAMLKPVTRVRLEAPESAVVSQVLVNEGDRVEPGQPTFRLWSPAADEEARRYLAERELHSKKSMAGQEAANAALVYESERRASSAEAARRSAEVRREFLLLRSPIAGRVLTSRTQDLTGKYVPEGTVLAEVGDCRKMAADIGVSERLLEYLKLGAPVTAMVGTSPMKPWKGSIVRISPATLSQPATASSGRDPSAPSASPDRFVATAVFDNLDGKLIPGASARMKIRADREAYALRAWRLFWRWLRTILW